MLFWALDCVELVPLCDDFDNGLQQDDFDDGDHHRDGVPAVLGTFRRILNRRAGSGLASLGARPVE